MFSFNDVIKYVGLAAVIYFLLKGFANNKLSNKEISIIVLIVIVLVIFICSQNFSCSKNRYGNRIESFGQQLQNNSDSDIENGQYTISGTKKPQTNGGEESTADLAKIFGIDSKKYREIIDRENKAKNAIKQSYKNDMVHTTTNPLNTIPLGASIYGYTFLPPENWFRAYDTPPVCYSIGDIDVASFAPKTTECLLEFDSSRDLQMAKWPSK